MVLGLVPDCDLDRVGAAGNAAGTGALIALLSGEARREIERVVRDGREDRDRGRAALPGALRRRDGVPPRDGAIDPNLASVVDAAGAAGRRDRRRIDAGTDAAAPVAAASAPSRSTAPQSAPRRTDR